MNKDIITHKFAIALNKTLEPGVAMNAIAHMSLGLAALATDQERKIMKFEPYIDGDQIIHPSISAWPVIILRGSHGDIKKFYKSAKEAKLLSTDFINTMTGGTYIKQIENTKLHNDQSLIYYGVAVFGEKVIVDSLTKKLSLWK